ncbi:MAG: bifunctional DNA-formamidopyrimidine glycosylase/DNA-(apurinic or apyrimidinic site) lyase [Gammaproteobacteria bacterium]|nr:bifunctional DNA-formamidopyrimidine glycosylase/DNA-(apurinic or apyrimidinic site) lyase [Gammaproteobacteria bacterium]
MPELPEVETTLRGIEPYLRRATIRDIVVRNGSLRWPVPEQALRELIGQPITQVHRRAKYILLQTPAGTILLHLGMSGSLRVLSSGQDPGRHDHLDIIVSGQRTVRLNDPRRFGCCLLLKEPVFSHTLLAKLGPEPISDAFHGDVLFDCSRGRTIAIKTLIMDAKVVVGVGNIYASEALFLAGIRPTLAAKRISRKRSHALANAIKTVLGKAIKAGGTTLQDFTRVDGKPGYFRHELQVYGRAGECCTICGCPIKSQRVGQRNSFYCPQCQTF